MSPFRIHATGLTQRFARGGAMVHVLDGVDLTLAAGELVAIAGPSLSGKTTLVELLAGWRQPDQGTVAWDGAGANGGPPPWSYLTVVSQALALLDELTVAENILLASRLVRSEPAATARLGELLAALGLERLRDRGAAEISIGERQRTMVARALVDQPQIVLADEPVAHQDQRHAEAVLRLLRDAVDAGASGVIATRQPDVAAVADRSISLG
ncbi:MAG: ATP-binding cassette domain-containing protein [Acidimicrobiales bacterium]